MSPEAAAGRILKSGADQVHLDVHEKTFEDEKHIEHALTPTKDANLVYDDNDEEPELHARTYFALLAMFFLNLVQVFALQGPPAVVRNK